MVWSLIDSIWKRRGFEKPTARNVKLTLEEATKPEIKPVRAEEYITPQKFLDGSPIPKWYQFNSTMVSEEDLEYGMRRTQEVDKRLVLPVRTHIRFLMTSMDVLHSWFVPSLGVKMDCVPGRLARVTTFIQREGVFYGACAEYCGENHPYMPIVVEAVSPEVYAAHAKATYMED